MRKLLGLILGLALWASPSWAVLPYTVMGNANYTMLSTDVRIVPTVALTANRTITLVGAATTAVGQGGPQGPQILGPISPYIEIIDLLGNVGGSNSCLVIAPASGDTLNGSTNSLTWCTTNGRITLWPLGGSQWFYQLDDDFYQANQNSPVATLTTTGVTANATPTATTLNSFSTSAPLLTTQVPNTITSAFLPPGDWDCRATAAPGYNAGNPAVTQFAAWVSTANPTTLAAAPNGNRAAADMNQDAGLAWIQTASISSPGWVLSIPPTRFTLATGASVFLGGVATFSTGAVQGLGNMSCRRAK